MNMLNKSQIIALEMNYVKLFTTVEVFPFGYAFSDPRQPDKYYHNYLHILNNRYSLKDLNFYYMNASKNGFVVYRIEQDVDMTHNPVLSGYMKSHHAYYAHQIHAIHIDEPRQSTIHQVNVDQDDEFFDFLYHEDLLFGEAYAQGNAKRQKEVLKASDNYIYFYLEHEQQVIGHINCYIENNHAKIDEFYITETYQKQGFGSALMAHMINYLKSKQVTEVYLVTDLEDTAKSLYERWGFQLVSTFYFFRKMIEEKKPAL
jgi:ribosomal protein S18 acetylase RimI-like enzyme